MLTMPYLPFHWECDLPKYSNGGLRPTLDPNADCFYVSDGWGNDLSALRLRKIDLSNGMEISSILLRDITNSLLFNSDQRTMFALLNARIVEIDPENLKTLEQWKDKVPKYSLYGGVWKRRLLLMNWLRPTLTIYDLDNRTTFRKIVGSCTGIVKFSENDFLICCGKQGVIWKFCCADNRLIKLLETPQFTSVLLTEDAGRLVLSLGNPYDIFPTRSVTYKTSRIIRVYNLRQNYTSIDYKFAHPFEKFSLNIEKNLLYLVSNREVISIYSIENEQSNFVRSGRIKSGYEISAIDVKRSLIIAISHDPQKRTSTIGVTSF